MTRRWRSARRRNKGESGSAVVEFIWLGLLLLVPLIYVMLSVFEVQRGAFAVTAAARAAGRAYALADSDGAGRQDALAVARLAFRDQGLAEAPINLTVRCAPDPRNCHAGGETITVTIRSQVRLPLLPDVLGGNAPSFRLDATHSVPFGEFREGAR